MASGTPNNMRQPRTLVAPHPAVDWFGSCQQAFGQCFDDGDAYLGAMARVTASRTGIQLDADKRLIAALSSVFEKSDERIRDVLVMRAPYVDPMNYIQLGFPERISLSRPFRKGFRLPNEIDLFEADQ